MSAHTPGPWSVHSYSPNEHVIPEVWGGDAGDFSDHIRRTEDARLISAAPDLLEALRIAERFCGSLTSDECPDSVAIPIRAAILKATGEQA